MRLLLTRPAEQNRSLQKKLKALGFEVRCLPLITIQPPSDRGWRLQKALKNIDHYDWLLLTSPNAAKAVFKFLPRQPKNMKVAVVGPATAALARKKGWKILQPKQSHGGDSLLGLLKKYSIQGKRFLYPTSQIGGAEVVSALRQRGAVVKRVTAYRTLPASFSVLKVKKILSRVDAVIFFSPSAAAAFNKKIKPSSVLLKGILLGAWGASTAKALRTKGYPVGFVSSESDEKKLIKELSHHCKM